MTNKKEILMQNNNLVKSKYDFTSIENKLFYKMLYNAQKQGNSPIMETVITVEELKKFIKRKNDYTANSIKEKLELFQQSILQFEYIEEETGHKVLFSSGLINTFKYYESQQIYKIQLHEILYKHITDTVKLQKEGYSAINLSILFNFKGAYTQRFYTLFRLWSRQNKEVEITFTIEQLREYLKMKPDQYPAYKNFKQKVITKALEEINKSGNMEVNIKSEIRKGRSIETIVFSVIDHEPRKYFEEKLIEVPTVLKDGAGEDVEVMQQAINVDVIEDNTPAEANDLNKYVCYPESDFLSPKPTKEFIQYCYDNVVNFTDSRTHNILIESQKAFTEQKGLQRINKMPDYKYFLGIFKRKLEDDLRKFNPESIISNEETEAPADATASEEGQGVELPSWIQNLNNYDK